LEPSLKGIFLYLKNLFKSLLFLSIFFTGLNCYAETISISCDNEKEESVAGETYLASVVQSYHGAFQRDDIPILLALSHRSLKIIWAVLVIYE
jgi:hypothetical protein